MGPSNTHNIPVLAKTSAAAERNNPPLDSPGAGDIASEVDAALVDALRSGRAQALAQLFDRHGAHVYRVLLRTLGPDVDLPDLVHDVFVEALEGIDELKEPGKLKSWLASIAVFTARGTIRRRQRWRWLARDGEVPAWSGPTTPGSAPPEISEALRSTYALLAKLPVDERICFALRFVDGMKLEEVAEACSASLATVKRRISRAEKRFRELASVHPALREWLVRGTRWSDEGQE